MRSSMLILLVSCWSWLVHWNYLLFTYKQLDCISCWLYIEMLWHYLILTMISFSCILKCPDINWSWLCLALVVYWNALELLLDLVLFRFATTICVNSFVQKWWLWSSAFISHAPCNCPKFCAMISNKWRI